MRDLKAIRSGSNARFRALLKLVQSSRERRRAELSLLDGVHLVAAYLAHCGPPVEIVTSESGCGAAEVAVLLEQLAPLIPVVLADGLFARLSSVVNPTGIIAVVRTPRPELALPRAGACLMLEDLQDPGNLGSILRSAAAAGLEHVLLSPNAVHAWSPRVLRAGMGAHFALRIHERVDLLAAAREFEGCVIATSQRAETSVFEADLTRDIALIFGNEGGGISAQLRAVAHRQVAIPMPGGADSLNVAAAAAVCLFERVRQMAASNGRKPAG